MAATQFRVSLSSLKVTLKLYLVSASVIDITRLTQDVKSAPSLVLQFCNCFKYIAPSPQACLIINLRRFSYRLKTQSALRFRNRYNKKATIPSPSCGMIWLCLLNQETTISVLELRVLGIFDDFLARFWSSLLRRSYRILKLKGILIASCY